MTQDEIDIMWQQAMQESIKDGEMFTRYHFAEMVTEAERERIKQANAPEIEKINAHIQKAMTALEEALAEHAMSEVQRLGQEIEPKIGCVNHDCAKCKERTEQEPVAWMWDVNNGGGYTSKGIGFMQTNIPFAKHTSLFTTPPQRTEQEPVAVKRMKEWVEFLKRQSDNGQHMNIPSSFGAGTCWEIAIELEQFINTTPPQRTWVGLTEEDRAEILSRKWWDFEDEFDVDGFLRLAEAKLKEKNT